jgi:hypothetical protein
MPYSNDTQNTQPIVKNSAPPEEPAVKNIGNGRLQVGKVIIDEIKNEVVVPGRLNMLE